MFVRRCSYGSASCMERGCFVEVTDAEALRMLLFDGAKPRDGVQVIDDQWGNDPTFEKRYVIFSTEWLTDAEA